MRIPPKALATLAVVLAALFIPACGGSEGTNPTTAAPSRGVDGEVAEKSEHQPKAKSAKRHTQEDHTAKEPNGKAEGSDKQSSSQNRSDEGGNPKAATGCPKAVSRQQCAAAGRAIEGGSSNPVSDSECPPSMDAASCKEAGDAYAQAEGEGRPTQSDECPRAMTAEECRVAGEAYADATK